MRTTRHLIFVRHFIVILLCALLCVAATPAQDRKTESQASNPITQDVTIIIQQQQVRFTARSTVEQLQLQIFNQSGELTFDSGLITVNEINWPFQNADGEAIKSGLYAYALSIKEAGTETARVRRGHFIVDRARDRDGADKLWVTSRDGSGIGTELTVARDETGAVAGTTTSSERALEQRGESQKRGNDERGVETDAQHQPAAAQSAAAITAGTMGRIAKFTSATELGNSAMTEANNNVGIGTTNPSGRLHIVGSAETAGTLWFQPDSGKGANHSHVHWGSTGDWYVRSAAAAGKVVLQDTGGNVGIGTSNPTSSRLTIEGQDALTVRGYQPFVTFLDGSNANARGAIQQVAGGLNLFTDSYLKGANPFAFLRLDNSGNLGIGSATPKAKLEVASGSGDILRLIGYEPFITLFDSNRGYTPTYIQNAGGSLVFKPAGFGACCAAMVIRETTGNVGIGPANPLDKLHVAGDYLRVDGRANEQVYIGGDGVGNDAQLGSANPSVANVVLWNRATNKHMKLVASALTITGGADFAENFDLSDAPKAPKAKAAQPGMVVSIDPAHPGKLKLSAQAYDRRVAGVISGAGGVNPGMMLSQAGTLADGQHPVALSGRVYVQVDASQGAVEPGDFLTTSPTPGHAMKATDSAKAQGAILGKAMTGLKEGKGLVLVLVTLQ
jgi:hypothetical protein